MGLTSDAALTLSTGDTVTLPLHCRARLGGAVFAAEWNHLRAALPADVTPLRLSPRRGAVALVGVDYDAVGSLDPYRELAVVVPVGQRTLGGTGVPTSLDGVGGYVVDLPVTTEPARALGEEVWGFPKSVTDIHVDATPTELDCTVSAEGRDDIRFAVGVGDSRARRIRQRLTAYAYLDDRLVGVPVDLDATVRVARDGHEASLGLGRGRYAAVLRDLGVQPRVYARFVASYVTADIGVPEPVRRQ